MEAFKKSKDDEEKGALRLAWQCTSVQRRSSLGKYIVS